MRVRFTLIQSVRQPPALLRGHRGLALRCTDCLLHRGIAKVNAHVMEVICPTQHTGTRLLGSRDIFNGRAKDDLSQESGSCKNTGNLFH